MVVIFRTALWVRGWGEREEAADNMATHKKEHIREPGGPED